MTKLYKRSEITLAVLWIAAYIVLGGAANYLSENVKIACSLTASLHAAMALVLFFWIRKNKLSVKYGLCRPKLRAKCFLYYLPLVFVASMSLWNGVSLKVGFSETVLFLVNMCCVGFLEELLFRGLLFRALEKESLKSAVIVSAFAFGLCHIVNLSGRVGQGFSSAMIQIMFAILIGLILALLFYRSASLIPCILFHSLNNALSAFQEKGTEGLQPNGVLRLLLVCVLLCGYMLYLIKAFPRKTES